jgi:hypothetical protein
MGVLERLSSRLRKRIERASEGGDGMSGRLRSDLYDGGGRRSSGSGVSGKNWLGAGEDDLERRFMRFVLRTRRNLCSISTTGSADDEGRTSGCGGRGGSLAGGGGGRPAMAGCRERERGESGGY